MKKILSVVFILFTLALAGCSDSGKDIEIGDFMTGETGRETFPTAPDEIAVPQTTASEEIPASQTTSGEAAKITEDETSPPLPEIEYVHLDDADLSHLYTDDEITLIDTPGAASVILYETCWHDLTVQLIGDFVQKRAGASENTLFVGSLQVRTLDGEGSELGNWRAEQNYSRHGGQSFYCEVDVSRLNDYLRVYSMSQNGREYPLIAAMQKTSGEEDYDTTFYTVTESGGMVSFYGVTDDETLQQLITTYDGGRIGGIVLSGDFAADGENRTLLDNRLGVRFSFDFENAAVTAEIT